MHEQFDIQCITLTLYTLDTRGLIQHIFGQTHSHLNTRYPCQYIPSNMASSMKALCEL